MGNVPRMVSDSRIRHVVVMGVSGVGKSTIAKGLSTLTGWTFAEGDAFPVSYTHLTLPTICSV